MKDFIVLIAFLILGGIIFTMIIGDGDGTLKNASKNLMQAQVQALGD